MKVIATTECDQDRVDLVSDLTGGSACLGDHFSVNFRKVRKRQGRPNVYLSGFPCRDWAHSGNKQMTKGSTGWMYEAQVDSILELEPDVAVLEQTDGILEEPENHTLKRIQERLAAKFSVRLFHLRVCEYGDPTNRARVFIIAIHIRHSPTWKYCTSSFRTRNLMTSSHQQHG